MLDAAGLLGDQNDKALVEWIIARNFPGCGVDRVVGDKGHVKHGNDVGQRKLTTEDKRVTQPREAVFRCREQKP